MKNPLYVIFVVITVLGLNFDASAADMVFPPDVFTPGVFIDITQPPYNVVPSSGVDCTAAIQAAIIATGTSDASVGRTIYFPTGTYVISDTLDGVYGTGTNIIRLAFIGQSATGTVIQLTSSNAAFQNPGQPKAMIKTESIYNTTYDGFNNFVWNMTLNVGGGNPGAVGIDFLGNNTASIRDVTITAPAGSGYAGVLMTRAYPGPCLLKNLTINGFPSGVVIGQSEYSITIEDLTLNGQSTVGLSNNALTVAIRNLFSNNSVPAITNASGLIVLIDSSATGGAVGSSAIVVSGSGGAFVRNFTTGGYQYAVQNNSPTGTRVNAPGGYVTEYSTHAVLTPGLASSGTVSLNLPINETPLFVDGTANWYSAGSPAGSGHSDQSAAIQAAIDYAANPANNITTLYFRPGRYYIANPLKFHGNIRRVLGNGACIMPMATSTTSMFGTSNPVGMQPVVIIGDPSGSGSADMVDSIQFDRFRISPTTLGAGGSPEFVAFQQNTSKPVIMRDMTSDSLIDAYQFTYIGCAGVGPLYLEDCCGTPWYFNHPGQMIWARQLNPEGTVTPKIVNNGSTLWILGFKTEQKGTQVASSAGAATEILGGFFYPVSSAPGNTPMLSCSNSLLSASYLTFSGGASDFPAQVQETLGGQTATTGTTLYPHTSMSTLVPIIVATPASLAVILDTDHQGQSVLTGTWTASTAVIGYHGTNYLDDEGNNKGRLSARFSPTVAIPGIYNVYLNWTAAGNRSTNVPVTVTDDNGSTQYVVDQTQHGGHFVLLGSHSCWLTSPTITISNTGTAPGTYVVADAVQISQAANDSLATIVDDSQPAPYVVLSGSWTLSGTNSTAWQGSCHTDSGANKGRCSAAFYPYVAQSGTYDVYARWPVASSLATNVPVTIFTGTTSTSAQVDESGNGGQWHYLGTCAFNSANVATDCILISNSGTTTGKAVAVDAVCLVLDMSTSSLLQLWRAQYFGNSNNSGIAADTATPAGDGVMNLIKYAVGISPLTHSSNPPAKTGQATVTGSGGGAAGGGGGSSAYMTFTFNRIADPTITYSVEAASDMTGTWSSIWSSTGASNVAGSVTVQDTVAMTQQARRFMRLRVSY